MTVEELVRALEEHWMDTSQWPVLVADGIGGWMTVVAVTDDEDRLILRLEPWLSSLTVAPGPF